MQYVGYVAYVTFLQSEDTLCQVIMAVWFHYILYTESKEKTLKFQSLRTTGL